MKDKHGREYASVETLKAGDMVQVDGDFTCIEPWSKLQVMEDKAGLYIPCKEGCHHLRGQIEDDYYIGVYPV